jgi:hypothetical protein
MQKRHKLPSTLAALVLTLGAAVVMAAPASAAGCSGVTCIGHDPDVEGCASSSITSAAAYSGSTKLANLWNKFSAACDANWSSAQLTSAAINSGDRLFVEITTIDRNGNEDFMCYPGPDNTGNTLESCWGYPNYGYCCAGYPYTDMVDGYRVTQSEVDVMDADGNLIATAKTTQK